MDTKQIIDEIVPKVLEASPDMAEEINATYTFKIEGEGEWFIDLTTPGGKIENGGKESDCSIETDSASFVEMAVGNLNTQMAFLAGKFRTDNPQLAVRLNALIEGIVEYVSENNLA